MCFAGEFPFQVSDGCRVCVRSPSDRVKIEGSRTVVRTGGNRLCGLHGFLPSVSSPLPPLPPPSSLSFLSASPTMTLVTRYLPHPRPADGFHTDVPKGIGPRWCTTIRLWNRGDAQSSITVINFAVRATNRRRFDASLARLRTSRLHRDII